MKLKESGIAEEVIAVSIGGKQTIDTLRTALAMGADRAIHIQTDKRTDIELPPIQVARALAQVAESEKVDVVLLGKQAIDEDGGMVGGMLAGALNWGQGTGASKVVVADDRKSMNVTREVDGGLQTVKLKLPAVITTDLRLNTPRYATLPNIMKAKKKPCTTKELLEVLKADADKHKYTDKNMEEWKVTNVNEPSARKGGVKVETVDDLISKLRDEAKVI